MFGLGFTELLLIMTLALLVLGPEKLPEVTRKAGRLLAELRRTAEEFRREIALPKVDLEEELLKPLPEEKQKKTSAEQ